MQCVNLGYQQKRLADFCDLLVTNGVQVLVDVRAVAWSQRPEFRKTALDSALAERGIEYVHCKIAGNPYRPKKGESMAFADCIRLYTRYLADNPQVIKTLAGIVVQKTSALLCYEASRDECHRGVLIKELSSSLPGLVVVDL